VGGAREAGGGGFTPQEKCILIFDPQSELTLNITYRNDTPC